MQINQRPQLKDRTALGLGGRAIAEVVLENETDFEQLAGLIDREGGQPLALGQGSNLLFASGDLGLLLIKPALKSLDCIEQSEGRAMVRAGAGTPLPLLLNRLLKHGLTGLEGLVGVPAALGGAVAMNAGAYGQDLQQVLHRVQIWSRDQGLLWLEKKDLELDYRHFRPKGLSGFWVIVQAELILQFSTKETVKARLQSNYAKKKSRQPVLAKTCGCVFKNPVYGPPSGLLLEKCGLKGYRLGGLAFSKQHANFLIHFGGGTSEQALELIELARDRVWRAYSLALQPELRIVGQGL